MSKQVQRKIKVHIRRGDKVRIISGNDRGKEGKVLSLDLRKYRAVVEGSRTLTRHVKPDAKNPKGTIEKKPLPIHISNLKLIDPASGEAVRIGRKRNEQGKLQRYSKKSKAFIDVQV